MKKDRKYFSVVIDVLVVILIIALIYFFRHSDLSPVEEIANWIAELPKPIVFLIVAIFSMHLIYDGIKHYKRSNISKARWRVISGVAILLGAVILML